MSTFARTDTSLVGHWWWTIDRLTLAAVLTLVGVGVVMTMAASPAVAERIGLDTFYFARRQVVLMPLAVVLMLAVSMLPVRGVRRLAIIGFAGFAVLLAATPILGEDIKGASRWIRIGGLSLQPSEFVKPCFAVVTAWMFAAGRTESDFPGFAIAAGLFAAVAALLLVQPDVGMTIVVAAVWAVQLFLAGVSLWLVSGLGLVFAAGGVAAYFAFGHVQARVDRFFDPSAGEGYQVMRAIEAFRNGGLWGRGPGEGQVKGLLPDAHADFVFAVVGEEFGLVACLILVGLFAFVVLRGFARVFRDDDLFVVLATGGLLGGFGVQALVNLASATHLMPPKGMTLPFVSYGGSSLLALALGMGMVLALTRRRPKRERLP